MKRLLWIVIGAMLFPLVSTAAPPLRAQLTVLYDAFGSGTAMEKDWGYSALIEFAGKRILFDTGNNPDVLARNAKARGLDLSKLDVVVLSHRHGDHMGGLAYILKVSPNSVIYAPKEGFGVFGAYVPGTFYRKDASLPAEERYFDGKPPDVLRTGSAWPNARFQLIDKDTAIAPGIELITRVSDKPGTMELRELSLALRTSQGIVVVVGCSHPGIDKIIAAAAALDPRIQLVAGGLHLVNTSDADIQAVVTVLHDTYKVEQVATGHCTGEPAFAALRKAFGTRYRYAGLGTTIDFKDAVP